MYIEIPEETVRRMREVAEGKDDFLAELLGNLLARHCGDAPKRATLADLGSHAREANASTPPPPLEIDNTSIISRDILNVEFADYLISRIEK